MATPLERAWTSVGTSSQSWFERVWTLRVSLVRRPSWVGRLEVRELDSRRRLISMLTRLPSWVGMAEVRAAAAVIEAADL